MRSTLAAPGRLLSCFAFVVLAFLVLAFVMLAFLVLASVLLAFVVLCLCQAGLGFGVIGFRPARRSRRCRGVVVSGATAAMIRTTTA